MASRDPRTTYAIRYDPDFVVVTDDADAAQWESENGARVTASTRGGA